MTARDGRPVRVCHVMLDLKVGGMQSFLLDLVRALGPESIETTVVLLDDDNPLAEDLPSHVERRVLGRTGSGSMLWPRPLMRVFEEVAPDVVHVHSGAWLKAAWAARNTNVPTIMYTDHGRPSSDSWIARRLDFVASRWTDLVVAVSADLALELSSFISSSARVTTVLNGVDTDRFSPSRSGVLRDEFGLDENAVVLGFVGRLEAVKSVDTLLYAFAQLLSSQSSGVTLVIVGDGEELEALRQLSEGLGIDGNVLFTGARRDVPELLTDFDIFTLASLSEGTSISLLEAMACGVCPIVTRVGGNGDVLGPRLSELMVPASDPSALADRWREVIGNPVLLSARGDEARARSLEFSLGRTASTYCSLYQALCRKRLPSGIE